MEADFSGYATKAGLKCSDGRTIMPNAFQHQDTFKVPLVWQHGHNDPENVIGHAILENRQDGVYTYGFFNETVKGAHARALVEHKDITMLSIWANQLIERGKSVLHGVIREVSLVLSGANPGALIENVTIRHSDDEDTVLDDEAIIYTGLSFEHAATSTVANLGHADNNSTKGDEKSLQDIYDTLNEEQKQLLHFMVGDALENGESAQQDALDKDKNDNENKNDDKNKNADGSLKHDDVDDKSDDKKGTKADSNVDDVDDTKKGSEMKHNVFESTGDKKDAPVLSHDDMQAIMSTAARTGSLKYAVEEYALAHNITDIDVLFPEAVNLDKEPQLLQRRVEWVGSLLSAVRKSPFSRIRTTAADITIEEARAKGYVTGALKKEEFFGVTRRITEPTTIYKKQTLNRDDVVDITDFDVVTWLKGEMRLMLDEELARAILIGDGRDISNEDKVNEQNIRPIASDHELFVTTITVNTKDASSSVNEVIDAIVKNRRFYKGTGMPNMYTSETLISQFLLLRDTVGRRIYKNIDEVASELRVSSIIPVEAMEEDPDLLAIIVNPTDYNVGATAGGQVSMFDDFDIDYNKQKYLIETRCSGALVRLKSALVVRAVAAGTDTAVVPNAPTFVQSTGVVTIVATTHIVYKNADTGATLSTGAQAAIPADSQINIVAEADSGYYIESTEQSYWTFLRP